MSRTFVSIWRRFESLNVFLYVFAGKCILNRFDYLPHPVSNRFCRYTPSDHWKRIGMAYVRSFIKICILTSYLDARMLLKIPWEAKFSIKRRVTVIHRSHVRKSKWMASRTIRFIYKWALWSVRPSKTQNRLCASTQIAAFTSHRSITGACIY